MDNNQKQLNALVNQIEELWQNKNQITDQNDQEWVKGEILVSSIMEQIEIGIFKVAEKIDEVWRVNQWLKKAILLNFKFSQMQIIENGCSKWFDKIPLRFKDYSPEDFRKIGIRAVPGSYIRRGSYIGKDTVLMPSFVNIGASIGEGSMIDSWATIGSCAQIGSNCHISGGAGIGGVLEPLQANPVIIEDNCFIGARSEIVDGIIIEQGSVIGMGVFIGSSTKIYNRLTGEILYGKIPPYSVVVPGSLPSSCGKVNLNCAVIVKQVDEKTRSKTALNELLRF